MEDSDKTRFDMCLAQAEFAYKCFDKRREYEWKLTLGFWAFIAVAVNFLRGGSLGWPVVALGAACLIVLHAFWIFNVSGANEHDKKRAWAFRDAAAAIGPAGIELPKLPASASWPWSALFQLLVTLIFLVFAVVVVSSNPERNGSMDVARSAAETAKAAAQITADAEKSFRQFAAANTRPCVQVPETPKRLSPKSAK